MARRRPSAAIGSPSLVEHRRTDDPFHRTPPASPPGGGRADLKVAVLIHLHNAAAGVERAREALRTRNRRGVRPPRCLPVEGSSRGPQHLSRAPTGHVAIGDLGV